MNTSDVNFRYMTMNFQITNWMATSLGLKPYSDVGYDVNVNEEVENTGNIYTKYYGEGSLSRAYAGLAVEPIKNISVGANLNYMFGTLNRNAEVYFLEAADFYNIQKYEKIRVTDFGFDFGIQAILPLKDQQHIVFGAILENQPKYTGYISDITQKNLTSGNNVDQDTLNY